MIEELTDSEALSRARDYVEFLNNHRYTLDEAGERISPGVVEFEARYFEARREPERFRIRVEKLENGNCNVYEPRTD